MDFVSERHPGRRVRLAYCQNLHGGEDLATLRAGIESITLPLKERLAPDRPFGVGMYLAATVAEHLASEEGVGDLQGLRSFLNEHDLVPFTYNAFPYGNFHTDGLKEGVYRPAWDSVERLAFTSQVARVAAQLAPEPGGHLSISTHPGGYGAWSDGPATLRSYADGMAAACVELARIEAEGGPSIVLSVEAEPRASAGNSPELAEYLVVARLRVARAIEAAGYADGKRLAARHLGTCLDTCHAAVEFEAPREAWRLARLGGPCGKLQFSNALRLESPGTEPALVERLLGMAEPRYLHQVGGRGRDGRLSAADLPEVLAELEAWRALDEWRCHFHVPVDRMEVDGLQTTRGFAGAALRSALDDPDGWPSQDFHLEIETYTWDVLPGPARGEGELVDGLQREYAHVIALLNELGWRLGGD